MKTRIRFAAVVLVSMLWLVSCRVPTPPVPPTDTPTPTMTPTPQPVLGYRVVGNKIIDENGIPHVFRGVTLPGLDWYHPEWGFEQYLNRDTISRIKSWNANVVRLPLFQRPWRENGEYIRKVQELVRWIKEENMDVVLDLHLSERGDPSMPFEDLKEPPMPDLGSVGFWVSVSAVFGDDPSIIFELYSEPHDVQPNVWLNGGNVEGYVSVGMQTIVDAIRNGGSENLIVVNGLNWGFNHSDLLRVVGNKIVYGSHTYTNWDESDEVGEWEEAWGFLTTSYPVILTSFGHINGDCDGKGPAAIESLLTFAEGSGVEGYIGWAWYVGGCEFPSIITSWDGTPTDTGKVVKKFLQLNP
ncbi:hypothetical protein A3D91_02240 [candidate division WWE3 bacterium RIFCSPHIGHO2_02_FULL_38_14]|uniref:Glycoside hydrolase family 5 domain-containing protein n=1 Tax=candidate division WWE3 bacterium RIFCSPHIGHO2_02_FULL_38_14 TaxID=1802620 RepID=A0A1F4V895_UNCKA|nr:MAG: hypothetical protein A3D91_02240 [candidate division WWE3 bacterium RIFCSPHIGHO2_02_FULL_38_14]